MMTIQGNINATFERMEVIIPYIEKKTLNVGANYLKEQVKEAFASKMPAATRPIRHQVGMRGYKINAGDTLLDAVRQSKVKGNTAKVHILGSNASGSGQFIARFYEDGTFKHSPRYQKTYKGKRLKKKKDLGSLTGLHFFRPTIDQQLERAIELMGRVYEAQIDNTINNGQ